MKAAVAPQATPTASTPPTDWKSVPYRTMQEAIVYLIDAVGNGSRAQRPRHPQSKTGTD